MTFNAQMLQQIAALHSNTTPEYSNMKFTTLILPALVAITTTAVAEMAPDLKARQCVTSACLCVPGHQGLFCGNQAINRACTTGHVFECNRQTGETCDYGPRDTCRQCGQPICPRRV